MEQLKCKYCIQVSNISIRWQLSSASTKKDCVQTVKHNETPVTALLCAPDGRLIASGTNDGKIKITDVTINKEKQTLTGHTSAITSLKAHPEELMIISSSLDKTVRVWDLDRFEVIYITELSSTPIRSVCFSRGDDFVAGN
jgi:WD40 repeat protein